MLITMMTLIYNIKPDGAQTKLNSIEKYSDNISNLS